MEGRDRDRTSPAAGQPLVSVIVPAWNAAATIETALASILEAADVALECVVVDDGSTDGTAAVVEALAAREPRVVLLRSPSNEGASEARNRALRSVRGEWLTFVDADDRLLPGGLSALWRASQASDALVIVGQRVWNNGVRTWITEKYDRPDIRLPGRKSIAANPGLLYYASSTGKLIHRSCTDGLWFHGRTIGDQPWTIRALLRAGDRIEVIEDVVYEWTRPAPGVQGTSITSMTRSQARLSAEAIAIARGAVQEVIDEAERTITDPAARERIPAAYVERLIDVDLAAHLRKALARADPDLADLLGAIEAFVRSVPPATIAASRVFTEAILVPPLESLQKSSSRTRRAYWSMFRAARRADPALVSKVRPAEARRKLRLVELLPGPIGPAVVRAWYRVGRLRRRVRRLRRRVTSSRPGPS